MPSKSVPVLTFALSSLIISALGQGSTSNLKCYYCESENTEGCEDPPNVAILASVQCSSLKYPSPEEGDERRVASSVVSSSVDGKFLGAPIIGEIFQGNTGERSALPFQYVCLKVTFRADGKNSTTRTCERLSNNIRDACDFTRHNVDPKFKVLSCGSCFTNNCNSGELVESTACDVEGCDSGPSLNASMLILLSCSLLSVILRLK